jgi:hypothetical protein
MPKNIVTFCFFLTLSAAVFAQAPANTLTEYQVNYEKRIHQDKIAGVYIPKDLFDAFKELDKKIDADSRQKFTAMTEEQAEHKLFFSLNRWICTNWGFYEGSRLSHYLRKTGVTFPEDMASLIIVAYQRNLLKKDLNVKGLVETYKEKRKQEQLKKLQTGTVIERKVTKIDTAKANAARKQ